MGYVGVIRDSVGNWELYYVCVPTTASMQVYVSVCVCVRVHVYVLEKTL